jgi:hypothetical protein
VHALQQMAYSSPSVVAVYAGTPSHAHPYIDHIGRSGSLPIMSMKKEIQRLA